MPTGYQIKDQSAAYYLTFQVVYWIDLFSRKSYRDILIEAYNIVRITKALKFSLMLS